MRNRPPPLGQHWLNHRQSLEAIVRAAGLVKGETVVEIGAGLGYLTDELIKTSARVVALEYDPELYRRCCDKYAGGPANLKLVQGDVRRFDWRAMPAGYKICANIPYYLTANLLRHLTDTGNKPSRAVLLVPDAVAAKVASSAVRSLLAVLVQGHYKVYLGVEVGRERFEPPPKVDSRVVVLEHAPIFADMKPGQWPELARFLRVGFAHPRKQLASNLRAGLDLSRQQAARVLATVPLDAKVRPGDLSHDQWWRLFLACPRPDRPT